MLALHILVRNHQTYFSAGKVRDDSQVFETTLDDQKLVDDLYQHFNQLERDIVAHSVLINGYSYSFEFLRDGKTIQAYQGATCSPMWWVWT